LTGYPDGAAGPGIDAGRPERSLSALLATLGWLVAWNLLRSSVPSLVRPYAGLVVAAGILAIARWAGISWSELGLARRDARRGLRMGLVAFAVITAVIVVAGLVPGVRELFDDSRVDVGPGGLAFRVLVAIPIGTVVVEEVAFRGGLLALLRRRMSTVAAVMTSSVLFGLWHLPPLDDPSAALAAGTLVATTIAGVGFCWLRLRSGSLLAPALAHLATNSVAYTVAWTLAREG
jgi:membrane protease YdiL (CAAX protease family)